MLPKLYAKKMICFENETINHGFCADCAEKMDNSLCKKCNSLSTTMFLFAASSHR